MHLHWKEGEKTKKTTELNATQTRNLGEEKQPSGWRSEYGMEGKKTRAKKKRRQPKPRTAHIAASLAVPMDPVRLFLLLFFSCSWDVRFLSGLWDPVSCVFPPRLWDPVSCVFPPLLSSLLFVSVVGAIFFYPLCCVHSIFLLL